VLKILIAGSPSKIFHLEEFAKSLEKIKVQCRVVIDTSVYSGFPSRNISKWFETKKRFNSLISEFKPDVIFVDRQTNFGLASTELDIPVLVHLRGDFWEEVEMAKKTLYKSPIMRGVIWYKERIANKCFDKSTAILPICEYLEKRVHNFFPNKKTDVLYQGIDPSKWYDEKGMNLKHPCVGLVQSANIWEKTKQLMYLPKVLEAFPDVTFYWVGDGPYRKEVLPFLEIYDNFNWLGKLDYPKKIRQFLTEIDIYALLTGIDMSPLSLQEAQLMKKPVIATNVGGIPELMKDRKTGFLVEKDNHLQIIEKISLLLNNKNQRKEMGENGREFVSKNFSWDVISKNFVDMMNRYTK